MTELTDEDKNRIEELKDIVCDALEEIKRLSYGRVLYDHCLNRFIEL